MSNQRGHWKELIKGHINWHGCATPCICPACIAGFTLLKQIQIEDKLNPDPVMMFRYSALTFNGHRIHYDVDYARDIEGWSAGVKKLLFHFHALLGGVHCGFRVHRSSCGFDDYPQHNLDCQSCQTSINGGRIRSFVQVTKIDS